MSSTVPYSRYLTNVCYFPPSTILGKADSYVTFIWQEHSLIQMSLTSKHCPVAKGSIVWDQKYWPGTGSSFL
jgi:hypothetical protein